jgi:hypothetical protein
MASMSDYLADALVKHVCTNTSYTSPTTVYLALYTTATAADGTGTEVTGGSYARQAVAFTFGAAGSGAVANTATETFTNMPACTVTHAAIWDAVTAGNMLFHGPLAASKVVPSGNDFAIAAGDIDVVIS